MITLYQFASSPFSEKVRRILGFKGLDYDIHEVDRAAIGQGIYAHISPTGKFPVMEIDGAFTHDSTDIALRLERECPEPSLIPRDARQAALAHVLEDWADESLYFYEMTARLSWKHNLEPALDGFAAGLPGVPRDALRAMILKGVGDLTKAQGVGRKSQEQVVAEIDRHYAAIDGLLGDGDWLAGLALSIADLSVLAQHNALQGATEAQEIASRRPRVVAWAARVGIIAPDR